MPRAREDLSALVAIPSVADERQYPREHCLRAADFVAELFAGAGIGGVRLLESPDGYPAVYGTRPGRTAPPPSSSTPTTTCSRRSARTRGTRRRLRSPPATTAAGTAAAPPTTR